MFLVNILKQQKNMLTVISIGKNIIILLQDIKRHLIAMLELLKQKIVIKVKDIEFIWIVLHWNY